MMSFKNILTIDVEEWYDRNDFDVPASFKSKSYVESNVLNLLELFSKYNVKATLFILGYIAKKFPDLIKKIDSSGSEVGLHHLTHNLLYDYTIDKFREEIIIAKDAIENIIGKKVIGFRAPSWSICEKNIWVLDVLKECGFSYDASIYPIKNFLYGVKGGNIFIYNYSENFYEVPPTVFQIFGGLRIPFSAGFYFRLFPEKIIKYFIKKINDDGHPVMISLHPWEIFPDFDKMKLSLKKSVIPYLNLNKCRAKLENLFKEYEFTSVKEFLLR